MSTSYVIFSCVLSANHLIKNVFHIVNLSRGYYIYGVFGILQAGWEWNALDRLEGGHLTNNNAEAGNKRTKLKELLVNRQISLKKYALDIFTNFLNVALVCNFKLASIESADGDKEPRRVRGANGGRMWAAPRYK